jgi:CHRD domain
MRRLRVKLALAVVAAAAIAVAVAAIAAAHGGNGIRERLTGYEETPALSTPGEGTFRAQINQNAGEIRWQLTFGHLESPATQAHIHFENRTNAGPIVAFLCSNLAGAPAGTQPCPAGGGTISGTITAANVGAGAAAQGLAAGEFDEFVRAIRAGATYVNVHTTGRPGGEIRAQLEDGKHFGRGHNHDDD